MKQDPRDAQIKTLLKAIELSDSADQHPDFWLRLMVDLRLHPGHFPAVVSVIRRREFLTRPNPFAFVRAASRGEAERLGLQQRRRRPTKWCLGEAQAPEFHSKDEDAPEDPFEVASDRWSFATWHRTQVGRDSVINIRRSYQSIDWAEVLMRAGVNADVMRYIIDWLHGEKEIPTEAVRKAFYRAKPALKEAIDIQRARRDTFGRKHAPAPYLKIAA